MISYLSYMDETGHADDPALHFAGMAGFVAPAGAWEVFEEQWLDTLDKAGLKEPFHMKEFAHFKGQFEEWKESERKRLLGRLIQIIKDTKAEPVGAIVSVDDFNTLTPVQQSSFLDPYYHAFQRCTRGAIASAIAENDPDERVAMVYSYNREFGTSSSSGVNMGGRAEQLWHAMKSSLDVGFRMGTYASTSPGELCPLQAADLFAYELSKEFENSVKRPDDRMRWGLREILTMVRFFLPRIVLIDRLTAWNYCGPSKRLISEIKQGLKNSANMTCYQR